MTDIISTSRYELRYINGTMLKIANDTISFDGSVSDCVGKMISHLQRTHGSKIGDGTMTDDQIKAVAYERCRAAVSKGKRST
jgi:hypothetical protein